MRRGIPYCDTCLHSDWSLVSIKQEVGNRCSGGSTPTAISGSCGGGRRLERVMFMRRGDRKLCRGFEDLRKRTHYDARTRADHEWCRAGGIVDLILRRGLPGPLLSGMRSDIFRREDKQAPISCRAGHSGVPFQEPVGIARAWCLSHLQLYQTRLAPHNLHRLRAFKET